MAMGPEKYKTIILQVEQNGCVCTAEIRIAFHGLYFCLNGGREMDGTIGVPIEHVFELVNCRAEAVYRKCGEG